MKHPGNCWIHVCERWSGWDDEVGAPEALPDSFPALMATRGQMFSRVQSLALYIEHSMTAFECWRGPDISFILSSCTLTPR